MSEEQKKMININQLDIIKWLLPLAITFIGWYVSQVVSPIAEQSERHELEFQEIKKDHKELRKLLSEDHEQLLILKFKFDHYLDNIDAE